MSHSKVISDEELKKDVLGAAISKELGYNNGAWENPESPLTKTEYRRIGVYSSYTVSQRFSSEESGENGNKSGWKKLKEELGLQINKKGKEYTPEECVERLKEQADGMVAPTEENVEKPTGSSYRRKDKLFASYLDAVWLAGLEPERSWFDHSNNFEEIYEHIYRGFTADNYWSGDPELDQKNFTAPTEPLSPYLNPRIEDLEEKTELTTNTIFDWRDLPNLRIGAKNNTVSRSEQEKIMEMIMNSETYIELIEKLDQEDIKQGRIEPMLNPGIDSEPHEDLELGDSYGKWMSQEEFPDNAPMIAYDNDPRPDPPADLLKD